MRFVPITYFTWKVLRVDVYGCEYGKLNFMQPRDRGAILDVCVCMCGGGGQHFLKWICVEMQSGVF